MHTAPAVTYPVGRSRRAATGMALLWLCGAAAAWAWAGQVAQPGWRQGLAWTLVAGAGVCCGVAWWASPRGALAWSGQGWGWQVAGGTTVQAGRVSVALDLQSVVLLHWHAEGGPRRWLWLERQSAPMLWEAIRRAVYSRARAEAPQGARPPVAER